MKKTIFKILGVSLCIGIGSLIPRLSYAAFTSTTNNLGSAYTINLSTDSLGENDTHTIYWYGSSGLMDIMNDPSKYTTQDDLLLALRKGYKSYSIYTNNYDNAITFNNGLFKITDRDYESSSLTMPYDLNADNDYVISALYNSNSYTSTSSFDEIEPGYVVPLGLTNHYNNAAETDYFNIYMMDKEANNAKGKLYFGDKECMGTSTALISLDSAQTGFSESLSASEQAKFWKIWKQEIDGKTYKVFEPADDDKRIVAHACFYMATKYFKTTSEKNDSANKQFGLSLTSYNHEYDNGSIDDTTVNRLFGDASALKRWSNMTSKKTNFEKYRNNIVFDNIHNVRNIYIDFPDKLSDVLFGDTFDLSAFNGVSFTEDVKGKTQTILKDNTHVYNVNYFSSEGKILSYSVSNSSIASVEYDNTSTSSCKSVKVTVLGTGSFDLKAYFIANDLTEYSNTLLINVIEKPAEAVNYSITLPEGVDVLHLNKANLNKVQNINDYVSVISSINPSDIHRINYTLSEEASSQEVTITSSNPSSVFVVNKSFICMAVGEATITISLKNYSYISASFIVKVDYANNGVGTISIANKGTFIELDTSGTNYASSVQLNVVIDTPEEDESYEFISGNSDIVSVDANGLVKALGVGSTKVTVSHTSKNTKDSQGNYVVISDSINILVSSNGEKLVGTDLSNAVTYVIIGSTVLAGLGFVVFALFVTFGKDKDANLKKENKEGQTKYNEEVEKKKKEKAAKKAQKELDKIREKEIKKMTK